MITYDFPIDFANCGFLPKYRGPDVFVFMGPLQTFSAARCHIELCAGRQQVILSRPEWCTCFRGFGKSGLRHFGSHTPRLPSPIFKILINVLSGKLRNPKSRQTGLICRKPIFYVRANLLGK